MRGLLHILVLLSAMIWRDIGSSKVTYQEAATRLREEIIKLRDEELLFTDMQDAIDGYSFKRTVLNAFTTIEQLTINMANFFEDNFDAVKNIQQKMEQLYDELDPEVVSGFDECCKLQENKLEYSTDFKTRVTGSCCYRRVPTSQIENILTSVELRQVMKLNRDTFPSVKWQYYGTEEGTIAIYPGHVADDCNDYDPRFRPWYVEVATPTAKDLVIVFDRSSSMESDNKLTLSKAAATTVINTLNPNDRVALVQFSSEAYTPLQIHGETCYRDQMAFATPEVKKHLEDYVKDIRPEGQTEYNKALEKAFEILKTAGDVPNTLERRKVILFLTDGGSQGGSDDSVKKLLSELNAEQNNRVLILTYGIGNDIVDGQQLLKDMANMTVYNRSAGDRQVGRFEHIQDTSQLRTKFGSYYNHFTGVLTLANPIVTVPYVDFFKLGHIFSVCLSVKHESRLKGVTCVDVLLNDIRQKFDFLEDESLYAFIIDQTGRTLLHPLLPSPGEEVQSDPLFVNISVLEPEAQKQGIIDSMRKLLEGQQEITKNMAVSRGNAIFDGTDEIHTRALYLWRRIPKTKFSVCLVVVPDHVDVELESRDTVTEFHYHLLETNDPRPEMCSHENQTVTTDYPTFYFSDKAYTEAPLHKDDKLYVDNIVAYMKGEIRSENFKFKSDARGSVAVMDQVSSKWSSSYKPYILQKYMGTFHGIYVSFPGRQLPDTFDHTINSWYRRAKKDLKSTILFRQNKGITLAKAITQGRDAFTSDGSVWGVMGIDLKTSFFRNLVQTVIENCGPSDNFSCFLMDNNGYLLFHRDVAENSTIGRIPIFRYEPALASSLIDKGVLQPTICTDYAWKEKYHTWKVQADATPVNSLGDYPFYFFTPIGDTNIYFFMKDDTRSSSFRPCGSCPKDSAFVAPIQCSSDNCYCPCHEDADYQYCTNSFSEPEGQSQPDPPCLKTEDTSDVVDESSSASHLSPCYPYTCSSFSSDECGVYSDCDWCYADKNSPTRSCQRKAQCIFEKPSSVTETSTANLRSTEDGKKNLASIIVPIVVAILLIVVLVIILVMCKRGLTPCNIFSKPKVQADGLYTDIPAADSTLNSRAQIIRQQPDGPYHSPPVGFVNHSYGSSSRISVIEASSSSNETPQYLTNNVILVPVPVSQAAGTHSSPDVSYLAVGSDLNVQAGQHSLPSSGYASPVPSSSSSQPTSGTGNAVVGSPIPAEPPLVRQDSHLSQLASQLVYINTPPATGTGAPSQQAFILTPVAASQISLNTHSKDLETSMSQPENMDCNAAEIPQHTAPPASNVQKMASQTDQHHQPEQLVSSHGYLTTGFNQK